MAEKSILVCIPAYNEGETLGNVIDDLERSPIRNLFDVLVVDDGSSDNTAQICRDKGIMVIPHVFNAGYGAALKTAYKYATERGYAYIIQLDADGQHDVCNIERIYERLLCCDELAPNIVIGSRFLSGSISFYIPFYKKLVISLINVLIRWTARQKITDPTSGLQGLNHEAFSFYARFNQFAIDYPDANMVIQMILNGFIIEEIPAVMHARDKGTSMHAGIYKPMKYIVKMLLSIFVIYLREGGKAKKVRRRAKQRAALGKKSAAAGAEQGAVGAGTGAGEKVAD